MLKLHSLFLGFLSPRLLLVLILILHLFLHLHSLPLHHFLFLLRAQEGSQLAVVSIDERDLDLKVEFFLIGALKADLFGFVILVQFSKFDEDAKVGHEEASKPIVLLVGGEEGEDVVVASIDGQDLVVLPLHLQVIIDRGRGLGLVVEDFPVMGQHGLLLDGGYECLLIGGAPFEMHESFTLDLLLNQWRVYLFSDAFCDVGTV